ncbi:MAG: type II secretion system protein GspG [bacterium]|nr:type II secretion system protein GspG [bacterium]MDW8164666.1 type II secretion system protein GspG [Candidatus Omnitrophota bacterium]
MTRRSKSGITLMEVLVSICIISFIAACSLPVLHRVRNKAVIAKTKAIINTIEAALSLYETDFGDYPHNNDNGSEIIVKLLQGPIESDKWNGPYIRFKKEEIDENGNILDAWKNPIIYKYPQIEYSNVPFLLISAGPDRRFGTKDDIGNW